MSDTKSIRIGALMLLAMSLLLGACSKDDPAAPEAPPADLNTFFAGLPAWESFSPVLPDADEPQGEPVTEDVTIDGADYVETTTPYSITRTPEKIVTLNPDVEVLWVGSLLQGNGYVGGIGSLAELPIRQRAPLTVSIDILTGDNTQVVDSPDQASVNQAIGELIQAAHDAGHTAGSDIYFNKETTYSLDQASIKMGISASYMGASIKSSLSAGMSSETRTVSAYFVQRMFTVSMVLPQTPNAVFSDAFTEDLLADQVNRGRMGPNNLPVYVSSIAYGRILIFTFSSTAMESDINATLNAVYNGGQFGGELSAEYQNILANAQISVVAVGGDAEHALQLIRTNNLAEFFSSDAPLTSARPISYTVRNLADNTIARVSETTDYNLREYTPAEMVVTGSRFRIQPFRLRGVAFPTIDPPGVNPIWDYFNAELFYSFYVQDAADMLPAVVFESAIGHFYAQRVSADENHDLKNTDGSGPSWVEVSIHYDGRDQVKLTGDVWDFDDLDPNDRFAVYNITYRWPANRLTAGVHSAVRGDNWGNDVRLYWRVEKLEDLYD
jgi:hypothetical protein